MHSLHIGVEGKKREINHLRADQTRVLVGILINLIHNNDQIIKWYHEKIVRYIDKLSSSNLIPHDIIFGYQYY